MSIASIAAGIRQRQKIANPKPIEKRYFDGINKNETRCPACNFIARYKFLRCPECLTMQ